MLTFLHCIVLMLVLKSFNDCRHHLDLIQHIQGQINPASAETGVVIHSVVTFVYGFYTGGPACCYADGLSELC
jgi:hypothetical protein